VSDILNPLVEPINPDPMCLSRLHPKLQAMAEAMRTFARPKADDEIDAYVATGEPLSLE